VRGSLHTAILFYSYHFISIDNPKLAEMVNMLQSMQDGEEAEEEEEEEE
jgi:hypothetical protein